MEYKLYFNNIEIKDIDKISFECNNNINTYNLELKVKNGSKIDNKLKELRRIKNEN